MSHCAQPPTEILLRGGLKDKGYYYPVVLELYLIPTLKIHQPLDRRREEEEDVLRSAAQNFFRRN
ncbi:hypothetical protein AAY473_037686 [Plecturocebus cupreus]